MRRFQNVFAIATLPEIVSAVVKDNEDAGYDELLEKVKTNFEKALSDKEIEKTVETFNLSFEENKRKYRFIANKQLEQIVYGNFETMINEYYNLLMGGIEHESFE